MRFLVTGGAGFIGRHLIHRLLGNGHEVRVLDNFLTGSREPFPDGIEVIEGDACDPQVVEPALREIHGVFHFAAIPSVIVSENTPLENQRAGEVALLTVLDAALRTPSVGRIVFASSAAVYGDSAPLPITEEVPTAPRSNYGVSKLASELYLRAACARQSRLDAACLRFFNVYGPGQRADSSYAGVITRFLSCLHSGERPTIFGTGQQTRDFIWVGDVARACLLAMECSRSLGGQPINIASGIASTVNDVWNAIACTTGTSLTPDYAPARSAEIRDSLADISLARFLLDFQAGTPLAAGIAGLLPPGGASSPLAPAAAS